MSSCWGFFTGPGWSAGIVVDWRPGRMPTPGELGLQRIESLVPELAEPAQPRVNLAQRPAFDGVEPASPLNADEHEPVLTQNAQMLGHSRLRHCELAPDHARDRA